MQMIIGNKYKWKCGHEILTYLGHNWSGNGYWHQFALVEKPEEVWCEVLERDLRLLEEVEPPKAAIADHHALIDAVVAWATDTSPRLRKIAIRERNDSAETQQAAISAAEAKRQRRAERNKRIREQKA